MYWNEKRRQGLLAILVLLVTAACDNSKELTGTIEDPSRNRMIEFQVWLPAQDGLDVQFPIVVLSHGSGGEYANHLWLIDALVNNDYVVAAVNHPGNTTRDNNDAGVISVWDRPEDLTLLLDHLLATPAWSKNIDPDRIGAAGFSSGGYTVIAMAGAIYDRNLMEAYCESEIHGPDCELGGDDSQVDYSRASNSYLDRRVQSVLAMAPAVGPAITEDSLRAIMVPTAIIAAADDELVKPVFSAERYARFIPDAKLELLPEGGHFVFLECNMITEIADTFIDQFDLCGRQFDVDRALIQQQVATDAVEFFNRHIGRPEPPGPGSVN